MRERVTLVPGFILHRTPYRDSSLLLEVLSREHGRVGLVARGVRSRSPALMQPLQPLLLSWTQSGELGNFAGAEPNGARIYLRGEALFAALYCNELLLRLLARHDPHSEVFEAYLRVLSGLAEGKTAVALRYFEYELLAALGYALNPAALPVEADTVCFDPLEGLRSPRRDERLPSASVASLVALQSRVLSDAQANELKPLLRAALDCHLTAGGMRTPGVWRALRQLQSHTV